MKLQKQIYLVASLYGRTKGQVMFAERFETWAYGPVLVSLRDLFRTGSAPIEDYVCDSARRTFSLDLSDDPRLRAIFGTVWRSTRYLTAAQCAELVRRRDSAWDMAFQRDAQFLEDVDVMLDTTYDDALDWTLLRHKNMR